MKKGFAYAVLLLLSGSAGADVFVRTTGSAAALAAAGGTTVYSAEAEINGSPVALSVRVFAGESNRRLASALAKTSRSNLVVIPSPIGPATVVISIDGNVRGGVPESAGIPVLPDFTPGFSAANHGTETRMVSGTSPFPPAEAMRSAAAAFVRQGWRSATPGETSCVFFTKGKSVALLSAAPNGSGSSVLVMVKNR